MIYEEVTKSDFCNNKRLRENFSYEGLAALYENIEEVGEDYELDAVGLCCYYAEGDIDEVLESYRLDSIDQLHEKTHVLLEKNGRVLYRQF